MHTHLLTQEFFPCTDNFIVMKWHVCMYYTYENKRKEADTCFWFITGNSVCLHACFDDVSSHEVFLFKDFQLAGEPWQTSVVGILPSLCCIDLVFINSKQPKSSTAVIHVYTNNPSILTQSRTQKQMMNVILKNNKPAKKEGTKSSFCCGDVLMSDTVSANSRSDKNPEFRQQKHLSISCWCKLCKS